MPDLRELTARFPRPGRIEAIFLRPSRDAEALPVDEALALATRGLQGDRSAQLASRRAGGHKRQVTLFQAEHLPALAAWTGHAQIDARLLRRNLLVSGLNLLSAKALFAGQAVHLLIGDEVVLEATGPCDPCSKMEAAFGHGAYNALRGHGGITAVVLRGGTIRRGDALRPIVDGLAG